LVPRGERREAHEVYYMFWVLLLSSLLGVLVIVRKGYLGVLLLILGKGLALTYIKAFMQSIMEMDRLNLKKFQQHILRFESVVGWLPSPSWVWLLREPRCDCVGFIFLCFSLYLLFWHPTTTFVRDKCPTYHSIKWGTGNAYIISFLEWTGNTIATEKLLTTSKLSSILV
jgi:hypothetical protein